MIRAITIWNFKSIPELKLELGRVNVLIGENGCGKSNILEAIALAGAAAQNRLDNDFLVSRGIRVTEPRFMRSAFEEGTADADIHIDVEQAGGVSAIVTLEHHAKSSYATWVRSHAGFDLMTLQGVLDRTQEMLKSLKDHAGANKVDPTDLFRTLHAAESEGFGALPSFLIYSPENSALRIFQPEAPVAIGPKGEGLFAYLKALSEGSDPGRFSEIVDRLSLLDWFERLAIPKDLAAFERRLEIRDRYLAEGALFDQRSANEGFLFLLFYFTLLISPDTPSFFAIDNIDASLNPKLCAELMRQLVELAEKHGKQVILTTHNPALLDGLNRDDDAQRLFVVYRDLNGHTTARRVGPPKPIEGVAPVALSEAFMRGYIGGLPENF